MVTRFSVAVALSLTVLPVLPARADIYKWIDANGQVNYSNKPPASAAKMAQPVEERISVVGGDGPARDATARLEARAAQRAHYEELDWQQRQRAMVVQRGTPTVACGYGGYCGDHYTSASYGAPYYPYYRAYSVIRPAHRPHVRHH